MVLQSGNYQKIFISTPSQRITVLLTMQKRKFGPNVDYGLLNWTLFGDNFVTNYRGVNGTYSKTSWAGND